jgi:branched-chain amino acid transport system ATP-binding protein
MSLLTVDDLCVSYGAIEAINGVDLEVRPGEAVAVLGANGAGKSTLLRTLAGLVRARSGQATFADEPVLGKRPAAIARSGLSLVPEGRQVFGRLTVMENLSLGAGVNGDRAAAPARIEEALDLFPRLRERARQFGGTLSGGEQQMLAIARALVGRPRLLMLDEPSMGLAPLLVRTNFDALGEIREHVSLLLVEQNVTSALALADRVYVLEMGRVVTSARASEIDSEALRAAYLGEGGPSTAAAPPASRDWNTTGGKT